MAISEKPIINRPELGERRFIEDGFNAVNQAFEDARDNAQNSTYSEGPQTHIGIRQHIGQNAAAIIQTDPRALLHSRGFNVSFGS